MTAPRLVSWFSCGAASAVATKLALDAHRASGSNREFVIAYCEIKQEHPDNVRFLRDCEKWFDHPIIILGNDDYGRDTDRVIRKTGYLVGPAGARCTVELKKAVRWAYARPDDVMVLGFTEDELQVRGERLRQSEPLTEFAYPLVDHRYSKQMCFDALQMAGIELPAMYRLGYKNNNCIGCVKGGAGYWNKIRRDFPERFAEMAKIERELGRTICKREWAENGKRKLDRIYLDELPEDLGRYEQEADISCGLLCAGLEAA